MGRYTIRLLPYNAQIQIIFPLFRFGSVFRNAIPPPRPYSPPTFEDIFGDSTTSTQRPTEGLTSTRRPAEDKKGAIGFNLGLDKHFKHLKPEEKVGSNPNPKQIFYFIRLSKNTFLWLMSTSTKKLRPSLYKLYLLNVCKLDFLFFFRRS